MRFINKYIISFLLLFSTSLLSAQNAAIEKANQLIASQRYASAYEVLQGSDPNDQSPEIAIARINLLLNFYIRTDKFHAFGLKDIAPNQNLQEFRENNVPVKMLTYKPDSILNKLIRQYPDNYKLYYALGNFYYEVHLVHPDDTWYKPDSVVVANIRENYLKAYNHGEFDYWSLFGIGYTYLLDEHYNKAIQFLEHSVKLNPDYSLTYYNLAYAYFSKEHTQKALSLALKAYDMQSIPIFKAETALLVATIYKELKNNQRSYEYLLKANKLHPNDYNVLVPLLEMELLLDKPEYSKRANELFLLDPSNPIIYQNIMKAYCENERDKEFVGFLESKRNEFKNSLPITANINLYMAIAQYEQDEWVASKINFEKARSLFRNFYRSDHNVFKVINSYTDAIKKKKK